MQNSNKLHIFSKNLNNKYKLVPFKVRECYVGDTKYLPPVSKEWKDTVYAFNHNNIKNLPVYGQNINLIIKNYFNLYFDSKFLLNKKKNLGASSNQHKYLSVNNIYVSQAEIKHTNNKALVTVYVYNREKISLLKRIKLLRKSFFQKLKLLVSAQAIDINNKKNIWNMDILNIQEELKLLRKYKLRLNLNLYKFEEKLLFKLNNLIQKLLNKKVEFNIVNLKSIVFNSEFFTKLLSLKLKKRKSNILRMMDIILNKVNLPKVNPIFEKSALIKGVNLNLLSNKFLKNDLSYILCASSDNKNNLSKLLNELFYNVILNNSIIKKYDIIHEIIFNSIKYKNIGGVRLEVKGRLTNRNRADRSLFKVRWKGGLKNIDSSYKRLSSVNLRGYAKPNVEYSIFTSKRPIGAFAIKGWVSGK